MNPFLSRKARIPFAEMTPEAAPPAVDEALAQAQRDLEALLGSSKRNFETILTLDSLTERLERPLGFISHLTSVKDSPELRDAFNDVLPRYTAFMTRLGLNPKLWQVIKEVADTPEAQALTGVRKRHLEKTVQEFVRAGAELSDTDKTRFEEINIDVSRLAQKFSENVLDATNAFELLVTDEAELAGLPESALKLAKASAEGKEQAGWRLTLQFPSYYPVMTYAENRALRETMYRAYTNRAGDGDLDNRKIITEILKLRRERAELLGFATHADYVLEPRMVSSGAEALAFVGGLAERTKPYWDEEIRALGAFAETLGLPNLKPWDVSFVAERLRQQNFDFDEEALRPYFPLNGVLDGLFSITKETFGVSVTRSDNPEVWHKDVEYYDLHDEDGTHLGSFYADWFPREDKRGGAWMNGLITGGLTSNGSGKGSKPNGFEPHIGLIACNFSPPEGDQPALLTHGEVETIFHEFGHLLHHCLSRVEIPARSGTSVAWDFVELPSQIMENWCWEEPALDRFARHVETGERIPHELFEKMRAARTFMGANMQMRQLSFATADLTLYTAYDPETDGDVVAYTQRVMEPFAIRPEFAHNSFVTSFSHIFSGGYSAGYYSYKWAEVLDADAFTRFQNEGLFNPETGRAYVETILSRGDSDAPEVLFHDFMGRDPDQAALLRRNLGIDEAA